MPSITFYLDINMDTLKERKKASGAEIDRLESQKDLFYERIRKGYLKIADKKSSRIVILDGTFSVEQLKKEIWEFVSSNFSL